MNTEPAEWVISLPWTTPPLHANQRLHWAARARLTRTVRDVTATLVRQCVVISVERCEVTLFWAPATRRRRDGQDNIVPTLKACCDGIVDAGVVPDDTQEVMVKHMPVVEPPKRPGWTWLTIRELP